MTFAAEGPTTTRVVLEHRHLERYGEAAGALRANIDSPNGWGKIMRSFVQAAEAGEAAAAPIDATV